MTLVTLVMDEAKEHWLLDALQTDLRWPDHLGFSRRSTGASIEQSKNYSTSGVMGRESTTYRSDNSVHKPFVHGDYAFLLI